MLLGLSGFRVLGASESSSRCSESSAPSRVWGGESSLSCFFCGLPGIPGILVAPH